MAIRTLKPTSPARRYLTYMVRDDITKLSPEFRVPAPGDRVVHCAKMVSLASIPPGEYVPTDEA